MLGLGPGSPVIMADDFVCKLLEDWGLATHISAFKSQGIGREAFKLLNSSVVKNILPLLGDQIVFAHHFDQFISNTSKDNTSDIICTAGSSRDSSGSNFDAQDVLSMEVVFEDDEVVPAVRVPPATDDLACQELKSILSSTAYGKSILSLSRKLRERERRKICDIFINHHLKVNPKERILSSQFEAWSQTLSAVFPKDPKVLFYSPSVKIGKQTIQSTGALRNAYYGFRREILQMFDDQSDDTGDEDESTSVHPPSPEINDSLNWLEKNFEPPEELMKHWMATCQHRMKLLCDSKSKVSIEEYINKFKVLRQPDGHLLIQTDFKATIHGDKHLGIHANLDSFIAKAYQELKDFRPRSKDLKAILTAEEISQKSGNRINKVRILLSLSYLVPCHNVTKKKGKGEDETKGWRPNKREIQNGFITMIDDVGKLHECVQRRDKRFQELKLTRQPFVILVGEDPDNIEASYVAINNFFYLLESPIEALDVCFKSFFTFNALYSVESRPLWMLLQTAVYKIFTEVDKQFATNSCLALLSKFQIVLP